MKIVLVYANKTSITYENVDTSKDFIISLEKAVASSHTAEDLCSIKHVIYDCKTCEFKSGDTPYELN